MIEVVSLRMDENVTNLHSLHSNDLEILIANTKDAIRKLHRYSSNVNDLIIQMPIILIEMIQHHYLSEGIINNGILDRKLNGISIIEGYEKNCIVVFHKECTVFEETECDKRVYKITFDYAK